MKLKHDKLLSNFAFNCNPRHYKEADVSKQDVDAQDALAPLIKVALETSKLTAFTGREVPTVIT